MYRFLGSTMRGDGPTASVTASSASGTPVGKQVRPVGKLVDMVTLAMHHRKALAFEVACMTRSTVARSMAALLSALTFVLPAQAEGPRAAGSSWTAIDPTDSMDIAARGAVVRAAPEEGPGVVRLEGLEDPLPVMVYPGLGSQVCDVCTFIYLKGVDFDDGIIEVDIKSQRTFAEEQDQRGFVGLVFNIDAALSGWEAVHFRPHNAVEAGQEDKAVQYSRLPMENWFFLRGGTAAIVNGELVDTTDYERVDIGKASKYEGTAKGIAPGQWFTARFVIAGDKVAVFVRPEGAGGFTRALTVASFNQPSATGLFGFYSEPRNTTFLRNARYLRMSAEEAAAWLAREP